MDKDPIREEAEKEVNAKFVKHPMEVDELGRVVDAQSEEKSICNCEIDRCRYIAKQMIEKHLREKAELQEETAALRSHNLELVEALNKIYSMPISSGFGDEQRIAQKALSSPQSEKYLKMVRVADFAERHLSSGWKEVYIGWRRMMNKVILSPDEHERFIEALKSYNSEKGGE